MAVKEGSSCCCFFWKTIFYALTRTWNVSAEAFSQIQDLSVEAAAAQDFVVQPHARETLVPQLKTIT